MRLEIHCRDMDCTDGIKTHIEDRADRLTRFIEEDQLVRVFVGMDGAQPFAEVVLHEHQQGKDLVCKETGENLYAQIDAVFDKATHMLHKHHDKVVSRAHKKESLKAVVNKG